MRCAKCKRPITSSQRKQAHIDYDDNGKPTGILHNKCYYVREKHTTKGGRVWGDKDKARYDPNAPTAYEMTSGRGVKRKEDENDQEAALAQRQKEIAEQEELEPRPQQWHDHHDPIETEI